MHSHFLNLGSLPHTAAPTDNNRNFRLTLQLLCLLWQREMKEMESNLSGSSSQLLTLIDQRLSFICFTCIPSTVHLAHFRSLFSHLTSMLSRWINFLWNSISLCLSDAVGPSVPCSSSLSLDIIKVTTYCISLYSHTHLWNSNLKWRKISTAFNVELRRYYQNIFLCLYFSHFFKIKAPNGNISLSGEFGVCRIF